MRMIKALLIGAVLALSTGCQFAARTADFINNNPFFVDSITRQAVVRYAEQGETAEERAQRAVEVEVVSKRMLAYIEGNPTADVDTILAVLEAQIAWERLSVADQMIVRDIIRLIEQDLRKKQIEKGINHNTAIAVKSLLETALSAAVYYNSLTR